MVRLVFRPYTQVGRSICTSESLRTSTRVSSGLVLPGHSSPSFGSRQVCSHSNPSHMIRVGRRCNPQGDPTNQLPCALRVYSPVDSHTCQTPWSVFQDGSGGLPTYSPQTTIAPPRENCPARSGFSPANPPPRDQPGQQETTSLPSGFSAPFPEGVIVRASRQPGEAHGAWTG